MSPLVDTLQATRQLEKAGFATPQAEAIVAIVAHAGTRLATKNDIERLQVSTKDDIKRVERVALATKEDIERLEVSTKKDIQNLRTELTAMMDTKIADLRADLLAKMSQQTNKQLMVMFAALGLLFVALRFT